MGYLLKKNRYLRSINGNLVFLENCFEDTIDINDVILTGHDKIINIKDVKNGNKQK